MGVDKIRDEFEKMLQNHDKVLSLLNCKERSLEIELTNLLEGMVIESSGQFLDNPIHVRVFWIDNYEVNACVAKIDDAYCFGLFNGLTTSLIDHIKTFYIDGLENLDGIILPSGNIYIDAFQDDSRQGKLGNYIFTMAFLYLTMHEYGHILCGHCDKVLSTSLFFEQSKDIKGSYNSQAKEYMADFYGIANSLNSILPSFLENPPDIGIIITLYITATHSIFWIFNSGKGSLENCDCSLMTHPHPMVRMGYVFRFIELELQHSLEMFEKYEKIIIKESDVGKKIIDAAFEDFLNVISRGDITLAINDLLSEKCGYEVKKISESAHKIKEYYRDIALVEYM